VSAFLLAPFFFKSGVYALQVAIAALCKSGARGIISCSNIGYLKLSFPVIPQSGNSIHLALTPEPSLAAAKAKTVSSG